MFFAMLADLPADPVLPDRQGPAAAGGPADPAVTAMPIFIAPIAGVVGPDHGQRLMAAGWRCGRRARVDRDRLVADDAAPDVVAPFFLRESAWRIFFAPARTSC
jgi:hypothetical protein